MSVRIISKENQAYGAFNGGEIIENKPIGFPQEGGAVKSYSNLFYWANAIAKVDSTIGLHPHQGFEIMSFVLEGNIRHYDTKLKTWRELGAGDVQIIRAGNGISHAEHMNADSRMFQIWFDPNLQKTLNKEATYDDYSVDTFKKVQSTNLDTIHYVGPDHPIQMDTPGVHISRSDISGDASMNISSEKTYSIYMLSGTMTANDQNVSVDDFIIVNDSDSLKLNGNGSFFMIETDKIPSYPTYAKMRG